MTSPTELLSAADQSRIEALLIDFDRNWTPHHLGVMSGQLEAETPAYREIALTEMVKIDLDYRQQSKETPRIEPYLRKFSKLGDSVDRIAELLRAEVELRQGTGDQATLAELQQRFPQLKDRLESILAEAAQTLRLSQERKAQRPQPTETDEPDATVSTNSIAEAAAETLPPTARKHASREVPDDHQGQRFGRYQLLRELGRGAMGTVYLAEDTELRRQVALKRPQLAGSEEASLMERFYREAHAAATLDHPNICPVYDIGQQGGIPFITMALVDGKPLSRIIRESRGLNPQAVAVLVRKVALALAEAHDKGVIHRDLKPGNIMLNHRNEPIVMDFGLARQVAQTDDRLTADGMLLGTPGYMSPEQVEGDLNAVGAASDIYSLGVVLFELLTGELPFRGSVTAVIGKILRDTSPAPSSRREGLPSDLDEICLRMMSKSPGDRFPTMRDVADGLGAFIRSSGECAATTEPPPVERVTTAQLEAEKNQILAMIAAGQSREASLRVQRMSELTGAVAEPYAQWASEQAVALHQQWQQQQQAAKRSVESAREQFARQDYASSAQMLLEIDKSLLTPEGKQLLDQSLKLQEEVDLLIHLIEQGLGGGKRAGMFRNMQRLLALKPKDPLVGDLYRKFRWLQRLGRLGATLADAFAFAIPSRARATFEEPMLRKWLALGALVFLISFGLMSWAVMIYLRGPKQTLAVEVSDELLASGAITLAVDGDDHVITGPDIKLKLTLGSHDFTVRQDDTVIHNPESFTIEKEGQQVLRISSSEMDVVGPASPTARPFPGSFANGGPSSHHKTSGQPTKILVPVRLKGPTSDVRPMRTAGERLFTADAKHALVYSMANRNELARIPLTHRANGLAVDRGGTRFAVAQRNSVQFWNVSSQAKELTVSLPDRSLIFYRLAGDEELNTVLATVVNSYATAKAPIWLYLVDRMEGTATRLIQLDANGYNRAEVEYDPHQRLFFASQMIPGRDQQSIYQIDPSTAQIESHKIRGPEGSGSLAPIIGLGKVALASWSGQTRIVNTSSWETDKVVRATDRLYDHFVVASPDGRLVATATNEAEGSNRVLITRLADQRELFEIPVTGIKELSRMCFSKDGGHIAFAGLPMDGNTSDDRFDIYLCQLPDTGGTPLSPSSSGGQSSPHQTRRARRLAVTEVYSFEQEGNAANHGLVFSPDRRTLYAAFGTKADGNIDVSLWSCLLDPSAEPKPVAKGGYDFDLTSDGRTMARGREAVELWDTEAWTQIRRLEAGGTGQSYGNTLFNFLDISPDDKWVAGSEVMGGDVYVWSLQTGKLATSFVVASDNNWSSRIEFSGDSRELVACTNVGGARVIHTLDLLTRQVSKHPLADSLGPAYFDLGEDNLAVLSGWGQPYVIDTQSWKVKRKFGAERHGLRVACSQASNLIAASDEENHNISLFDARTFLPLQDIPAGERQPVQLRFSDDGGKLAMISRSGGSQDKQPRVGVQVWEISDSSDGPDE